MSATPITPNPDDPNFAEAADQPAPAVPANHTAATDHPDPITGEPGAHPVGVGVGAVGAGAAGAAIGSIGGPIGMLIGAAIGAVAGGLAGKEVATITDAPEVSSAGATTLSSAEEPPMVLPTDDPSPITTDAVPGESFRPAAGSGFADDVGLSMTGASPLPATPPVDLEDDALPMTAATGLQAPPVPEAEPLMNSMMPANGEEAVRVAAYYHYLDRIRSGQPGDAVADWLEAEHEMMLS